MLDLLKLAVKTLENEKNGVNELLEKGEQSISMNQFFGLDENVKDDANEEA